MDDLQFDAFARALAKRGGTRRTVVAALVGAVAGGLGLAVRPERPAVARNTPASVSTPAAGAVETDSAEVAVCHEGQTLLVREADLQEHLADGDFPGPCCPQCGACQVCTVDVAASEVTCGATCADPCLASTVCAEAQQHDAYRLLAGFLGDGGFAPAGEPRALAVEADGVVLIERIAVEYLHRRDPARTATLAFVREPGGGSDAHAVVSQDQIPQDGLIVDDGGRVERTAVDLTPATAQTGSVSLAANTGAIGNAASCTGCDACDIMCNIPTTAAGCIALGARLCNVNVQCNVALNAACNAATFFGCGPFCELFGCAVCDQHCENRTSDCAICIDRCQQNDPNQRCVDGRCRCVEYDPRVGDTCGPVDSPVCCDPLQCEGCDFQSGQCRVRCRGTEVCCGGDCRSDMIACGPTCCPILVDGQTAGLICCDDACVNWQISREHCGDCGNRCGDGDICELGMCRPCDAGRCEVIDDGRCVYACSDDEACDPSQGCIRVDEPSSGCDAPPDFVEDLDTGDGLVRIDIGRASKTIENTMVSGSLVSGPITGHPEFTIWVAPSQEDCTLRTDVAFGSNPPDCTFTVEDGPDFLVGKMLALDEINCTLFYAWHGGDDVEKMLNFVGTSKPRCLDLSWYFRIFETGVMLGYPEGLDRIDEIDPGGRACVVSCQSNTTEYTTSSRSTRRFDLGLLERR